jgi:hypothetical protein
MMSLPAVPLPLFSRTKSETTGVVPAAFAAQTITMGATRNQTKSVTAALAGAASPNATLAAIPFITHFVVRVMVFTFSHSPLFGNLKKFRCRSCLKSASSHPRNQ